MRSSRINRAFVRYRTTGDPAWLAMVFDCTAPELLRLAWHLVGDSHAAEDLVQTTFLTAIEAAQTFVPDRDVLPWLCGILANRAREQRRHHRPPEAVEPRLDIVDPHAEVYAREISATVAAAVRALPEPYRQVLLLHLEHGLSGKQIAETLARPEATARSQIHRGLDLLRKTLPLGLAGTARAMVPAMTLANVRAAVLAKAGSAFPITPFVLAWTMKKITAVAVVVLVALGCAWPLIREDAAMLIQSGNSLARSETPSATSLPLAKERLDVRREPADGGAVPADRMAKLEVTVQWADGQPAIDVIVICVPLCYRPELFEQTARTGATGLACFAGLPPGNAFVRGDRSGSARADLVPGRTTKVALSILAGVDVHGRVVDSQGQPVAGAEVWLSGSGPSAPTATAITRSAQDGTFALRAVPPKMSLGAWAEDRATALGTAVVADADGRFDCTLQLGEPLGRVEGTVVDAHGSPIAGATVLVSHRDLELRARRAFQLREPIPQPSRYVRTDAEGHFLARGVPRGAMRVWAAAPKHAAWFGALETAQNPMPLTITLPVGATVRGVAKDRDGLPRSDVQVAAHAEATGSELDGRMGGPPWAIPSIQTDAHGLYVFAHVTPGATMLRARRGRDRCAAPFMLHDGQTLDWNPQFGTGPRFVGVVVDPAGTPLADWEVQARNDSAMTQRTDTLGRFEIEVEDAAYDLWLVPPLVDAAALRRPGLRPQPEPLRLEVPWSRIPSARVTGEILHSDGTSAPEARIELLLLHEDGSSRSLSRGITVAGGRFTSGPLFPGRYCLRATRPLLGTLHTAPFAVLRDATVDVGTVRFERPGSLTVRVVAVNGAIPARDGILFRAEGEPVGFMASAPKGTARFGHLQPGVYYVSTHYPMALTTRRVEIQPDQDTTVELHEPVGVKCVVRWPPISCDDHLLHLVWRNESGEVAIDSFGNNDRNEKGFSMTMSIPPGRYTIEVEDGSGRKATTTADVHAAEPPVVVLLPLPGAK